MQWNEPSRGDTLWVLQLTALAEEGSMKLSKAELRSSTHSLPKLRFEDQDLTSFAGVVLFQKLFRALNLKGRLYACVRHLRSSSCYGLASILEVLTLHLMLGWRRLRDLDYYREDPLVLRVLGLRRLPNVATLTRALRKFDGGVVERIRGLLRALVLDRVGTLGLGRLTVDFDGSVLTTKSRNTEGTAVGFNPKSKGNRSYYPLLATVAQTGQVLDLLHRPGNVHDSHGSREFFEECFDRIEESGFRGVLEARIDSAHFSDATCLQLEARSIHFTVSVPFERFPDLKERIAQRQRWWPIDGEWSCFEMDWRPKSWPRAFRCFVFRQRVPVPRKGPIQLDLFRPLERSLEYKVVMTNKEGSARAILSFHNGRGAQEGIFAELKSQLQLDYIPTRRLLGNEVFSLCSTLAHNLARELQMLEHPPIPTNTLARACLWVFERFGSLRKRLIQRAGRLTRPHGELTLTMSANAEVQSQIARYLTALDRAA